MTTHKTHGLSIRIAENNPNHHLYRNNGGRWTTPNTRPQSRPVAFGAASGPAISSLAVAAVTRYSPGLGFSRGNPSIGRAKPMVTMNENERIFLEHLCGNDWEELARRFPEAFRFLRLCALHNELQKMKLPLNAADGRDAPVGACQRPAEIIQQMADHAMSKDRWDPLFL